MQVRQPCRSVAGRRPIAAKVLIRGPMAAHGCPMDFPMPSPEAEAAHARALYAAENTDGPADWQTALQHLEQAAGLGHTLAQAELAALAGEWQVARAIERGETPTPEWAQLRRSIDLSKWLTPPPIRRLSPRPRIATVEGMASPELCDWLIARARPRLTRAEVYDHDTGQQRVEEVRTNTACYFLWQDSDVLLLMLRAKMAQAAELPVYAMESTAVLHYTVGEEFLPHFDFLDVSQPGPAKDVAGRGQRVLTFLIALNDDYDGGETEFPELGKRWKGRKGNGLFFWNVEPDGSPDRLTRHAGLPPARGEKWLLSQWIRGRAA
jgi:prolyl 4-hydroxylase